MKQEAQDLSSSGQRFKIRMHNKTKVGAYPSITRRPFTMSCKQSLNCSFTRKTKSISLKVIIDNGRGQESWRNCHHDKNHQEVMQKQIGPTKNALSLGRPMWLILVFNSNEDVEMVVHMKMRWEFAASMEQLRNRDNQEQWQYRGLPVQQIVGLPTVQQAQQQIIGLPAVQQAQQQSFRMQHTMNQPTNILPQSSRISSMQAQQASQAGSGLNRRELPLGANRVPPHAVRFWMAANSDRLQTTVGSVAANPSQRTPVGMRLSGSDRPTTGAVAASNSSQTVTGLSGSDCLQATTGIEEQHNWRAATGRMRGSLSGSAYESALNQYLVPSTQPALTVTSASDPIQQEIFKPDDAGRQLGP